MDHAMNEIRDAIKNGDPQKADYLLEQYVQNTGRQNDTIAILDACIGDLSGDRMRIWDAIRNGLLFNYRNYELYVMLGDYYQSENLEQSYLCYENALYYSGQ